MHLSFTFRSLEANDSLKEYASEKLERIRKYFPEPIKVHVVFSQQRGYLFAADVQITLHNGIMVKGVEANEDYYSSIDLAVAKIERQLRKYKDRIREHKPATGPERSVRHSVMAYEQAQAPGAQSAASQQSAQSAASAGHSPAPASQAPAAEPAPAAPSQSSRPKVVKEEKFIAQPMSVEDAIMRMNLLHESFLCFNNDETHEINVVYRREDGTYGLIETTHAGDKVQGSADNG
jgi:putative sigma-54 modulation protein